MADRWERPLPCQDAHGRDRELTVFVSAENLVGLRTPPGESALISPEVVKQVQSALMAAVIETTHRVAE